uniref:Uncharacterized protein n=1 Tax=Odontella aurita TaxID=265563 RepID=A0A6U6L9S7_9STRA|mmetsp:Transcript_7410/g.21836  ORF Transcript_7410/g.21836 Transcript_7410/m.21836 type:complete len:829 (+) Transcript_7410:178-2664(+)|eukprot:CAMPEP_0113559614 /NCGR_PEP_ID=MMETSP0015_2-20120614/18993_1 /TAXON_ID=2838 /ORGANISM="Odontella" /LENGTH=828 /DNA_ID=CAMNT_0000461267 /DNA_START=106 /DNA_END=2592 /DNA_ORIENTATION=- /assembly_acc=CAM_ASM_000160
MTSIVLRIGRSHAPAAVASFAATALIAASATSLQNDARATNDNKHSLSEGDRLHGHDALSNAGTSTALGHKYVVSDAMKLLSRFRLNSRPPVCNCDTQRSRRDLQRSQTIRRMDIVATKGKTLESRYSVDRSAPPLGEGAFGAVHLATDRLTGEHVALKRIPKRMTDDEAFQREMNALIRISSLGGHPNICALRENFIEGPDYSLILDYISGGEMFDHLINNGAYSEADAARLVREVASALAYLHGIGIVHADLKPENLMLSSQQASDAVVKLVDFGCAEVMQDEDDMLGEGNETDDDNQQARGGGLTVAYCPPESLRMGEAVRPSTDMWSLGVILYIMLTGLHPFDLSGTSSDDEIEERIKKGEFRLRDSPITNHLSESAKDLIERLMENDAAKRMTAEEMLHHSWVRGETATKDIIAGSDTRLSKFRVFKSKLQAKFFQDCVIWSDDEEEGTRRKTSLIERAFKSIDEKNKGFLTARDLGKNFGEGSLSKAEASTYNTDESGTDLISMSDFHNLLSENMQHKYFPRGTIIYHEGDQGNHMYFINSGTIEVSTKGGSRATRTQGDFFGEGALLHPKRIRSATIKCKTPVHAMEISREYFEKYLATSESGLLLTLREKDKIRKRNRAKAILRLQNNLQEADYGKGDVLFKVGEDCDTLFIVESGKVDIVVGNKLVLSATPGNICGEHSVITGQRRNSKAICASLEGCKVHKMLGADFRKLMDLSPEVKASLFDLYIRRDFKKAVVYRLNKEFPYDNPREAFDAVKGDKSGDVLTAEDIGNLMREMSPDFTDDDVHALIQTIDLTNSGDVSFDEFRKVFIADIRTSASI